jgi:Rod binding domain-containing protein
MYSYMLVDTLAQKLTEGRGMGLAPIIAQQLTPRGAAHAVPPGAVK